MAASPVVLIVESSPELRRMLEESLQGRGYGVASATTADEALAMLHRQRADLVIADPPSGGAVEKRALDDLCRAFPEIPCIIVSPDVFDPAIFAPARDGEAARRMLRRPFTLAELLMLTERLLPNGDGGPKRR